MNYIFSTELHELFGIPQTYMYHSDETARHTLYNGHNVYLLISVEVGYFVWTVRCLVSFGKDCPLLDIIFHVNLLFCCNRSVRL